MKWRRQTKIVGILYQERQNADLQLLGGSQITGVTYLQKNSAEVKLLSASNADLSLLRDAAVAGVLYQDHGAADVRLLPGSQIAAILYADSNELGLQLLRVLNSELRLISGHNVSGLLYQEQGGAEVTLLSDTNDLSIASAAKLVGVLHRPDQAGALRLVSGHNVSGLLYQEQGGAELTLLTDTKDLSIARAAKLIGILFRSEAPS